MPDLIGAGVIRHRRSCGPEPPPGPPCGPWRNRAAEKYREILEKRSPEEMRTLAQVKRLLERYQGDCEFRAKLTHDLDNLEGVARPYGIDIDPGQALPLFSPDHQRFRSAEGEDRWPLAKLWDDYLRDLQKICEISQEAGGCAEANPRFHGWRQRQMQRCASELGPVARHITHPVLAFELSAGCSVGCWFCGVSAERFEGNFLYTPENARLWHGMLKEAADLFGPAVQQGFCYWATDPSDNPDYPKFLEDYYRVTGNLPQTTTAAPLKDLAWTRWIMRLFDKYRCVPNRFSILTLRILNQVHATFTPVELMGVELVLHNREALQSKATAGRARERAGRPTQPRHDCSDAAQTEYSTIACVSGFLVNTVRRTVQLIAPTRSSDRWPLGYRIFGERHFATPREFRAALEDLIAVHMPENLTGSEMIGFRDDLLYQRSPGGFELRSSNWRFNFDGTGAGLIGELIHQGGRTVGEIEAEVARAGGNIFVAADTLQKIFDRGLLSDDRGLERTELAQPWNDFVSIAAAAK